MGEAADFTGFCAVLVTGVGQSVTPHILPAALVSSLAFGRNGWFEGCFSTGGKWVSFSRGHGGCERSELNTSQRVRGQTCALALW